MALEAPPCNRRLPAAAATAAVGVFVALSAQGCSSGTCELEGHDASKCADGDCCVDTADPNDSNNYAACKGGYRYSATSTQCWTGCKFCYAFCCTHPDGVVEEDDEAGPRGWLYFLGFFLGFSFCFSCTVGCYCSKNPGWKDTVWKVVVVVCLVTAIGYHAALAPAATEEEAGTLGLMGGLGDLVGLVGGILLFFFVVPRFEALTKEQPRMDPPPEPHLVPYSRMSVRASGEGAGPGEVAKNLLDENQSTRVPPFFTNKWNTHGARNTWLEIEVQGPALNLARYSLRSANDCPGRDPRDWTLTGITGTGTAVQLDHARGVNWQGRWAWNDFFVSNSDGAAFNKFRLDISANHGDGCTQLGQLKFYETPEAERVVVGTAVGIGQGTTTGGCSKTLAEMVAALRKDLEIHQGSMSEAVDKACEQLGICAAGLTLMQRAEACYASLYMPGNMPSNQVDDDESNESAEY